TSLSLREGCEGCGGTKSEDEMEEWEPAETPPKNAGSGEHGEDENDKEKSHFPSDRFPKSAAVGDQGSEQCRRSDRAARQFGSRMWLELGQKVGPTHCPRGQNQPRPRIPGNEPLPVGGGIERLSCRPVDVNEQ